MDSTTLYDRENISGRCTRLAAGKRTSRRKNKKDKNRREWEGGGADNWKLEEHANFLENVKLEEFLP